MLVEQSFYQVHVSAFPFFVTGQFFWTFSEDDNVQEIVNSCSLFFCWGQQFSFTFTISKYKLPTSSSREKDYLSRSKTNSGSSEVLVHSGSISCLLAQANFVEFPKSVGKLDSSEAVFAAGAGTWTGSNLGASAGPRGLGVSHAESSHAVLRLGHTGWFYWLSSYRERFC